MSIATVLTGYATLVASLALAISLLALRELPGRAGQPGRPDHPGRSGPPPAGGPDVGSQAPPFLAGTSTGASLEFADLAGRPYLLAFLSGSCPGCRDSLPPLAGYVGLAASPPRLIVVIVGDPARGADIARLVAPIATVVLEPDAGRIASAYRVVGFPTYVLVSAAATVLATGRSVLELPQPQPQ